MGNVNVKDKNNECSHSTFNLFVSLSNKPMNDLDFDDVMFLSGHDKCCGERNRKVNQEKRVLILC